MDFVCETNRSNEMNAGNSFQPWINTSQALVEEALDRWDSKELRADNVSVVCVIFNSLQEEQKSEMPSTIQQMSSIEVGQHILLDHCYEETFKLKMLENFTCAYNDQVINRDTHSTVNSIDSQFIANNQCIVGGEDVTSMICNNVKYENSSLDRSIVSHEIENASVSSPPDCSKGSLLNTLNAKIESMDTSTTSDDEYYSDLKLPKINNKENSKIQKKVQTTSNNKFYETRQKDRKMRSGHVCSSTVKESTRRRSTKLNLPVISDNNHHESTRAAHSKKVNISPSTVEVKVLRSSGSFFLKEHDRSSGNSKYLKLNNIFLTRKRKLFGTKSTKRLNTTEKVTKKSQSKH